MWCKLIIVSGFSGSGKTTLCHALSEITSTQPVRTSDFLIERLGELRDKEERLFAWQHRSEELLTEEELRVGRLADADHLHLATEQNGGVHESMTLPLLVLPSSSICRVFLDVASTIRYIRVAMRHNIDVESASLLGKRKDAQTRLYLQRAYGVLPMSPSHLVHYDVIMRVNADNKMAWEERSVSPENRALLLAATEQIAST